MRRKQKDNLIKGISCVAIVIIVVAISMTLNVDKKPGSIATPLSKPPEENVSSTYTPKPLPAARPNYTKPGSIATTLSTPPEEKTSTYTPKSSPVVRHNYNYSPSTNLTIVPKENKKIELNKESAVLSVPSSSELDDEFVLPENTTIRSRAFKVSYVDDDGAPVTGHKIVVEAENTTNPDKPIKARYVELHVEKQSAKLKFEE